MALLPLLLLGLCFVPETLRFVTVGKRKYSRTGKNVCAWGDAR